MAIYDVNGNIIADTHDIDGATVSSLYDINGIPQYFVDELRDTADKVGALQTDNSLTFAVVTDIHYGSVDKIVFPHTLDNINAFSKLVHLDGIICLGDMTDGDKAKTVTTDLLEEIMPSMRDIGIPVYFCAGNHDCNAYTGGSVYTTEEMYYNYYKYGTHNVFFDADSYCVNFYKDFSTQKVRMISLDSAKSDDGSAYHYYYPMNTVDWFANVAMATLPQDYSVLLISHVSPIANHNWKDTCPPNNADVVSTLETFVNNGGRVICIIGHSHADFDFTTPWLDIAVYCNKLYRYEDIVITEETASDWLLPVGAKIWSREMGTVKEDCWDVAVINPSAVNMIRFGAGEDRSYSY